MVKESQITVPYHNGMPKYYRTHYANKDKKQTGILDWSEDDIKQNKE